MIPTGLKVGDTFVDGSETFRVTKVVGEMYESQVYESQLVEESDGFFSAEETEPEKVDYNTMPYAALKKMCAEKGLNAKGSKEELIARLEG